MGVQVAVLLVAAISNGESLFQVGNSLTEDSAPNGIVSIAESAGIDLTSGLHLRSSSSVETIWNDPTDYTRIRNEYGTFDEALPNNTWDHVVLQVFEDGVSTLGDDIEAFERYRSLTTQLPANADTQFYVYGAWPWSSRWDRWDRGISTNEQTLSTHRPQYFDSLVDRLNEPEDDRWRLIPTGEVFAEIRERIAGEGFGGLGSVSDIYRDVIHANGIGRFAAATTVFATVFETNPVGLPVPYGANPLWNAGILPADLALEIQELVWEVVLRTKRAGVSPLGDFDVSTEIDEQDYAFWAGSHSAQSTLSADANGDGVVDQTDGELWAAAVEQGSADFDGDGTIGESDRETWADDFGSQGASLDSDANGDGVVNAIDYAIWRDEYVLRQSTDFNSDGVVDAGDAAIWQAELGWSVELPTDANGDGVVNAVEYTIWRDNRAIYNTPLSVSIPEPSTALLAAVGGLALVVRRRVA